MYFFILISFLCIIIQSYMYGQRFPQGFVFKSPWDFHGLFGGVPLTELGTHLIFLGGLTDRAGELFNFFGGSH